MSETIRRLSAFVIVACLCLACAAPLYAWPGKGSKSSASQKASKQQQKAMKKYQKAQKKAQKKMLKQDRKNTHYPKHNY